MEEMKACPFCGVVPIIELDGAIYRLRARHKPECFIRQMNGMNMEGQMSAFNPQCLIETWNHRAEIS